MSRPRGSSRRRLIILTGALPVFLAAVLVLYRPSLVGRLDDSTYDLLLRSAQATPPAARVVIVDIDERSLTTVGQWPWRRDVVGRLISRLRDAGAAVIALDVIFAESDRYEQGADPARDAGSDMTPDGKLAATLRQGRVVLGYGLTFDAAPLGARPVRAASPRRRHHPSAGRCGPRAVFPGHRRRLQSADPRAGGAGVWFPERGARFRRHSAACAAGRRVRWTSLSQSGARCGGSHHRARATSRCAS